MYSSIVVGTDGSATADVAVDAAISLAKALGSRLHLACASESAHASAALAATAGVAVPWEDVDRALASRSVEVLEAARHRASDAGVEATTHPCTGPAAEAIVALAETEHADLVVVGNKGMHGARRFLGSVPNAVAHHAPCAVLIVPTA